MSVTMMDNSGQSTPVDVRTECEDLRAQLARARAAVLRLLAHWGEGDSFEGWAQGRADSELDARWYSVEKAFSITEEELAAEYQRQYDEWVRESSDGQ